MSEYQCYEFLAIDRPLTAEQMAELRKLSTRATITPVSFTNKYNWGSFKEDPEKLMERFFDAHVYVANWMTAIFMLRLPIDAIAKETAEALAVPDLLEFRATPTHWIITWSLTESENDERFGMEDGRDWMARLAPVREELLRGDLRGLYIGWLPAVAMPIVDEDELEPVPMEGLASLTPAQRALAEFLEIDPDLLAGAGMGSPDLRDEALSPEAVARWIEGLPRDEVTAVLRQLIEGRGQQAERALKNRFAQWRKSLQGDSGGTPRRRVSELLKNAEAAHAIRLDRQKREQEQAEVKRRKDREAYLKALAMDLPKAWGAVRQTVERGSGLAYDEACRAMVDLAEAYSLQGDRHGFERDYKVFMAEHLRRKTLIARLVKAGIWYDM